MNDPRPSELSELNEIHDERLSECYRTACNAEPPAWLDQRILTAAQTAVNPRPPLSAQMPRPMAISQRASMRLIRRDTSIIDAIMPAPRGAMTMPAVNTG